MDFIKNILNSSENKQNEEPLPWERAAVSSQNNAQFNSASSPKTNQFSSTNIQANGKSNFSSSQSNTQSNSDSNQTKGQSGKNQFPWENKTSTTSSNQNNKSALLSNWLGNKNKMVVLGVCIVCLVILGVGIFNLVAPNNKVTVEAGQNEQDLQPTKIQVHVTGQVVNPGVYKLNSGSRAIDAINMAGGFTQNADQTCLNLAKEIEDGEQIVVTSTVSSSSSSESQDSSGSSSTSNGKVNINTADLTQLQTLTGVGPSTAQKIIDYRNANGKFKTIEDIKKVSGIGDKTYAKFADKICV